jgi:hypothetical protein
MLETLLWRKAAPAPYIGCDVFSRPQREKHDERIFHQTTAILVISTQATDI